MRASDGAIERLRRKRYRPIGDAKHNPYRGLHVFEERHQDLFFGRATDVNAVVERLRTNHIVVVAGDSGIGKSSLCRAGVLPALPYAHLDSRQTWSQIVMSPGLHPVRSLAHALAGFVGADAQQVERDLYTDPTSIIAATRYRNADRGLVILVDQLEELVVMSEAQEAAAFEDWLAQVSSGYEGLRVLASARSDFLTGLASLPQVGSAIAQGLYLLRPLVTDQLRTIVVGPAEATGASFESDAFVDELVNSVSEDHGALPLLQFTLAKLWLARDPQTGVIGHTALTAVGGLTGALSQHADEVLAALSPDEQTMARQALVQLVTSEGTRTIRTAGQLGAETPGRARALEMLVQGRLVTALQSDGDRAYQLAHEVLIRSWPKLRDWLATSDEMRRNQEHLDRAVRDWRGQGEPVDALWSARQLREHAPSSTESIDSDARRFLRASRRRVWWNTARTIGLSLALPALSFGVYVGARQQNNRAIAARVQTLVDDAQTSADRAQAAEDQALDLRQAMHRQLTHYERAAAEDNWQQVQTLEVEADDYRRRAMGSLEAAIMLRPNDIRLRGHFADELVDRLLLARRRRRNDLADELLARLSVYDRHGKRRRRLNSPSILTFHSAHPCEVEVERYVDERGVRTRQPIGRYDASFALPPGDYRLRITPADRPVVLWPLRVAAGEDQAFDLDRLDARRVPESYVLIPTGTSYMGTDDEDSGRIGFFDAPPLHPVKVADFAIARNEVTFAEYIAFLDDLDSAERHRFLPGTQGTGTGTM
ncbi:MAG: hypothetical protein AAF449_16605, partial [Myxococcota bacterium]